jgi:CubicO group peptidase (beta-lactamase class C family)
VANLVPPVFFQVSNGFSSGPYYPTYLQLASHSSGLPDFLPTDLTTIDQFWDFLQQEVVRSDTVNAYSYSDQGFVAVGQAVATIADPQNPSYHDYVTENILLPLDMSGSTFDYTEISAIRRASPYRLQDSAFVLDPSGNIANFPLAGNVWTTAVEMAQIISLQFRTAPVVRGNQILACQSIQEMWEPVVPTDGGGDATIGWFLVPFQGQFLISKNGGSATWATLVQFLPDKRLGVVAFTNVGGDEPQADLVKLERTIFEALAPLLPSQPPVCPPGGAR